MFITGSRESRPEVQHLVYAGVGIASDILTKNVCVDLRILSIVAYRWNVEVRAYQDAR